LDPPKIEDMNSGISIGSRPDDHKEIMGNTEQPWFHIEAVEFLFNNLNKDHTGFEFGSGSSTFWFSEFTKKITSVESDPSWYREVQKTMERNGIQNINSILSPCRMLSIWDLDTETSGEYETYSDIILRQNDNFDYISVDGVARSLCIKKSIEKLNPGGYLIIDNSERPAYWDAIGLVPKKWEKIIFRNRVDQTSIYRKN
jgi:hypothetical protein